MQRIPRRLHIVLFTLALAGCSAVGAAPSWLALMLCAMLVTACAGSSSGGGGSTSTGGTEDVTTNDAVEDTGATDASAAADGAAQADGLASRQDSASPTADVMVVLDATTAADAGPKGTWEPCCKDGVISTCLCPAGAACNYGWFTKCSDTTCVGGGQSCDDAGGDAVGGDTVAPIDAGGADATVIDAGQPDAGQPDAGQPDAAAVDAGGKWEKCCKNGKVDQCLCPFGVACNYGMFKDCGNGACAMPNQPCPP